MLATLVMLTYPEADARWNARCSIRNVLDLHQSTRGSTRMAKTAFAFRGERYREQRKKIYIINSSHPPQR
jgi:hypothetical protein